MHDSTITQIRHRAGLLESWVTIDFNPENDPTLFDMDVKARNHTLEPEEVREFQRWLVSKRSEFIRLYHGTWDGHDVINKGLLPTTTKRRNSYQSSSGYVYLTYDPQRARSFGSMAYPGRGIVVYAADVLVRSLHPDKDQLANMRSVGYDIGDSLAESFIYGAGARVKGKVTNISVFREFPR